MFGYIGKVLSVNLTKSQITSEELREEILKKFIGGVGVASYLYIKKTNPHIDALSAENLLVFMTGPLTGTMSIGCGRHAIVSKSPLTGILGVSTSGGYFGAELKFAGFDGIIISGRANHPVYLIINDGEADLKDAEHLWGLNTLETEVFLKKEIKDPHIKIACIGLAGERLVKIANIVNDGGYNVAGRCGLGAVMGSKNLKAIVVKGTKRVNIANEKKLKNLIKHIAQRMKLNPLVKELRKYGTAGAVNASAIRGNLPTRNWSRAPNVEEAEKISGEEIARLLRKTVSCFGCPISCKRQIEIKYGPYAGVSGHGPEYESIASLGSLIENYNLEALCKANELCNNYGIDTISCGEILAFITECYQKGLIRKEDIGNLDINWGDADTYISLIHMIGKREGVGSFLGEGVRSCARVLNAEEFAMHIKGLELPMHDPRVHAGAALSYATSNRGACHLTSFVRQVERGTTFPEIGINVPLDPFEYKGKAEVVIKGENIYSVVDSLVMCKFMITHRVYLITEIPELISAVTGFDMDVKDIFKIGERIFNLQRFFNTKLGITRKNDDLPRRIKEMVSPEGSKWHAPTLELMLKEYYVLRNWDEDGKPSQSKLIELGLDEFFN